MTRRQGRDEADPRISLAKMVLALGGVAVFGAGIRWESGPVRWVGIGLVGTAWLLRLANRAKSDAEDNSEPNV